ncbi:response regulator transcription factor [Streptomyces sp. ID05-26A]|nr:response regulator transcription factor [Streptomyces sp. ID05-26A]
MSFTCNQNLRQAAGQRAARAGSALLAVFDEALRNAMVRRFVSMGVDIVYEAEDVTEMMRLADHVPAGDVAVVDLSHRAYHALGLLKGRGWSSVIAMTSGKRPAELRFAVRAGADGWLVNPAAPVASAPQPVRDAAGPDVLSAREVEVVRLVAEGMTNADIGAELRLSSLTVKSHMTRIGRKLLVGDRAGIVAVAMRAGLVT